MLWRAVLHHEVCCVGECSCGTVLLQVAEGERTAAALRTAEQEREASQKSSEDARAALQALQVRSCRYGSDIV